MSISQPVRPIVDLIKKQTTQLGVIENLYGNVFEPAEGPAEVTGAKWFYVFGTGETPRDVLIDAGNNDRTFFELIPVSGIADFSYVIDTDAVGSLMIYTGTLAAAGQGDSPTNAPIEIEAPGADIALYVNNVAVKRSTDRLRTVMLLPNNRSVIQIIVSRTTVTDIRISVPTSLPIGYLPPAPQAPTWKEVEPVYYAFLGTQDTSGAVVLSWADSSFAGSWDIERTSYRRLGPMLTYNLDTETNLYTITLTGDFSTVGGEALVHPNIVLGRIMEATFDGVTTTTLTVKSTVAQGSWDGRNLWVSDVRGLLTTAEREDIYVPRTGYFRFLDTSISESMPYTYRLKAIHPLHTSLQSVWSTPQTVFALDTDPPASITIRSATMVNGDIVVDYTSPDDIDYAGVRVFKEDTGTYTEILTDMGMPNIDDQLRFTPPGVGTYWFRSFDWARNIQTEGDGEYVYYDGKLHLTRPPTGLLRAVVNETTGTADLYLSVVGNAKNYPITVEVYDDPAGGPLLLESPDVTSFEFETDGEIGPTGGTARGGGALTDTFAGLTGIELPANGVKRWWARLVDNEDSELWLFTVGDRNTIPGGLITVNDYQAAPTFSMVYDDDVSTIIMNIPGSKTKTYSRANGGLLETGSGVVVYTVGTTVLDDATTETLLTPGTERGPYDIYYTGGGVSQLFWSGYIHGATVATTIAGKLYTRPGDQLGQIDLLLEITGPSSAFPLSVTVYQGSPTTPMDGMPIEYAYEAGVVEIAANITLPSNMSSINWWAKVTTAQDNESWLYTSEDRDADPEGSVTINDYRAKPVMTIVYDADVASVVLTVPGGHTKTWTRADGLQASGAGTVTYTVGDTLAAQGGGTTTEADLLVDSTRTGYSVNITGGGLSKQVFQGALHGPASNPPTARTRVVIDPTNRDVADVYVALDSPVDEDVTAEFTGADTGSAPVYQMVESEGSSVISYVSGAGSGTEIGPTAWFKEVGASTWVQPLNNITLLANQTARIYVRAKSKDSGVYGQWVPVVLPVMEDAWIESLSLSWDEILNKLFMTAVGGGFIQGVRLQIDDDSAFGSPVTLDQAADQQLTEGNATTVSVSLSGTQRGKKWYGRAIPFNKWDNGVAGKQGKITQVVEYVPKEPPFTYTVTFAQDDQYGIAEVSLNDPDGAVTAIYFKGVTGGGAYVLGDPSDESWTEDTAAPYSGSVLLTASHTSVLAWALEYKDQAGGTLYEIGYTTFDLNLQSNIQRIVVTFEADGHSNILVEGDEDTKHTYITVDVDADPDDPTLLANDGTAAGASHEYHIESPVTPAGGTLHVKARGKDDNAVLGPVAIARIKRATAAPSLTVLPEAASDTSHAKYSWVADATSCQLTFANLGTPVYTNGGGATTLSGSVEVPRPAAGAAAGVITFAATRDGITVSNTVTITSIEAKPSISLRELGALATSDVWADMTDPGGKGGIVYVWVNKSGYTSPDPSGNADGTFTIASTPATVGPTTNFTVGGGTSQLLNDITKPANTRKHIFVEFVTTDARSTGRVDWVLEDTITGLIDETGDWRIGAVANTSALAPALRPITPFMTYADRNAVPAGNWLDGDCCYVDADMTFWTWNYGSQSWSAGAGTPYVSVGVMAAASIRAAHFSGDVADFVYAEAETAVVDKLLVGDLTIKGHLDGVDGTFSGALTAASGTFSGALSAATGTYDGTLRITGTNPIIFGESNYWDLASIGLFSGAGTYSLDLAVGGPAPASISLFSSPIESPPNIWPYSYVTIEPKLIVTGPLEVSEYADISGAVTVGTTLDVTGNATALDFIKSSARKLKKNIVPLSTPTAKRALLELAPVEYDWRITNAHDWGFVADDVPDIFAATGRTGINISRIVTALVAVAQQHEDQLAVLLRREA